MDEIDQAQGHNEDFQAAALRLQQTNREPTNYTGTDCLDCEEEIPEKRRAAVPGCRRCIDCQTLLENWRPLYRAELAALDVQIMGLNTTFSLKMLNEASPVLRQIRAELDGITNRTINISAVYTRAYADAGSGGFGDSPGFSDSASIPSYDVGTPYVPRTTLALVHQGERIVTASDNARGNSSSSSSFTMGDLHITLPNVTNQSSADDLMRQMIPAMKKYAGRSL